MGRAWPAGASTGVGSLPFTDPVESVKLVLGEQGALPYLPELPNRGVGADAIGRTASVLVDLPVEYLTGGWTVTSAPGRDLARADDYLRWDVDALIEHGQGAPLVKVQVVGPMTLAAMLELPTLYKLLTDHGAVREVGESLVEGVARHVAFLSKHLPGTTVVLQVDEPLMPAVLSGRVKTPSGLGSVAAIERSVAEPALARLLSVVPDGHRVVHCCAADAPLDLFAAAGANAVSVDLALFGPERYDALGEAVDGGVSLWLGVVPGIDSTLVRSKVTESITSLWNQLGFPRSALAESVVPTPSCGLAGASGGYVRKAMTVLREVGQELGDLS